MCSYHSPNLQEKRRARKAESQQDGGEDLAREEDPVGSLGSILNPLRSSSDRLLPMSTGFSFWPDGKLQSLSERVNALILLPFLS